MILIFFEKRIFILNMKERNHHNCEHAEEGSFGMKYEFSVPKLFQFKAKTNENDCERERERKIKSVSVHTNHSHSTKLITYVQKFHCKIQQTSRIRVWCHFFRLNFADLACKETIYRCCFKAVGLSSKKQNKVKIEKQTKKHLAGVYLAFNLWIAQRIQRKPKIYNRVVKPFGDCVSYKLIAWQSLLYYQTIKNQ